MEMFNYLINANLNDVKNCFYNYSSTSSKSNVKISAIYYENDFWYNILKFLQPKDRSAICTVDKTVFQAYKDIDYLPEDQKILSLIPLFKSRPGWIHPDYIHQSGLLAYSSEFVKDCLSSKENYPSTEARVIAIYARCKYTYDMTGIGRQSRSSRVPKSRAGFINSSTESDIPKIIKPIHEYVYKSEKLLTAKSSIIPFIASATFTHICVKGWLIEEKIAVGCYEDGKHILQIIGNEKHGPACAAMFLLDLNIACDVYTLIRGIYNNREEYLEYKQEQEKGVMKDYSKWNRPEAFKEILTRYQVSFEEKEITVNDPVVWQEILDEKGSLYIHIDNNINNETAPQNKMYKYEPYQITCCRFILDAIDSDYATIRDPHHGVRVNVETSSFIKVIQNSQQEGTYTYIVNSENK